MSNKFKKLFIPILSTTIISFPIIVTSCATFQQGSEKLYLQYHSLQTEQAKQEFENYNQINLLSEINKYFLKHDHSQQLVKFKIAGASGATVEFNNLMKNNYAYKYIKFDENEFKRIIKEKFNLSTKFINRLKFLIDYTNINRDYANNFDVIFPVKVQLPLLSHNNFSYAKGLFIEQIINFKIKDVKRSRLEQIDTKNIEEIFKKIKSFENKNQFTATIKSDIKNQKESIEKWGLNELDSKQLETIFDLKVKEFDDIQKDNTSNTNIKFKKTITGVDLSNEKLAFNEGYLKVRLAIGEKNKDIVKAESGITTFVKFNFNEDDQFWRDIKLNEILKVNTIKNPETNTDFSNLTKNNLLIKSNSKNISDVKIRQIKNANDYRNAELELDLTLKDNKKVKLHKKIGIGQYTNLFESDFVKQNIQAPVFATERLTQEDLKSINKDSLRFYGSELFSGGYGTSRGFYDEKTTTPKFMHIGEDYIANDFQPVVMPYDGEIIAAYELTTDQPFTGVGTVLVAKIPINNLSFTPREKEIYLNDNSDSVYVSFLHLDAQRTLENKTLNWSVQNVNLTTNRIIKAVTSVTPLTPTHVKKGTIIGYLGNNASNGGWMSHAHVNFYTNRPSYLSANYFSTKTTSSPVNKNRVDRYYDKSKNKFSTFGNTGVESNSSSFVVYDVEPITGKEKLNGKDKIKTNETPAYLTNLSMSRFEKTKGYANPNLLYKLRDERTPAYSVKEFNKLN